MHEIACCYCGDVAVGRYCFLNQQREVVDNPFCSDHTVEVYKQTKKGLSELHRPASLEREIMLKERWSRGGNAPPMPRNKQELLSKGGIYQH